MRFSNTPAAAIASIWLLLMLGGCMPDPFGRPYAAYSDAPTSSLRGQCERATYDDPEVKQAMGMVAGQHSGEKLDRLAAVRREVIQRCMYQRGGPLQGGGVELPRSGY
jgi:hypothetical protein